MEWLNVLESHGTALLGPTVWMVLWTIIKIVVIAVPIILCVAYLTFWERKMIGWMHVRLGPNRVGPKGLLQPIADVFKLLFKEVVVPSQANKVLFIVAPVVTLMPALAAWAVVPFGPDVVLANVNAGLLYLMAITSMGVYGVILAGWASNSKYAFLGALRASAQMVSYEIAMGFVLVTVLMVSGSLNLSRDRACAEPRLVRRQGPDVPVLELAAAVAAVRGLLHLRPSPKPTATRSTWWKANRKSWPAT